MKDNFIEFFNDFLLLFQKGEQVSKFLLPTFITMIILERVVYLILKKRYNAKDAFSNISITITNFIFTILIGGLIQFLIFIYLYQNFRLFEIGYHWYDWLLVLFLQELVFYIDHRLAHTTGFFWAFHQVHHSSKEFNFTNASRGFILDSVFTKPLFYLMPIFGVSGYHLAFVVTLQFVWGIFNHTKFFRNMWFFEYILQTPSNHRVHHGADIKYLDKNYGQVFTIWDILFKTFKREEEEPNYGLTTNINTYNIAKIQLSGISGLIKQIHSADKWSDKLKYLYMPPGWDHRGNHQTTKALIDREIKMKEKSFDF